MRQVEISTNGASGIAVAGEIDLTVSTELADRIAALGHSPRVDLRDCTFIDSSGISVLVQAHNGQLTLIAPSPCVTQLLTICGLDAILAIEPPGSP